jgi:hypothetical protein
MLTASILIVGDNGQLIKVLLDSVLQFLLKLGYSLLSS